MPPHLTINQRCLIIWRLAQGVPQHVVAREVPCSQSQVSYVGRQWVRTGTIEPKKPGGRKRGTTTDEDHRIVEAGTYYKFDTIAKLNTKIREELNIQLNVCNMTLNRRLLGNYLIFRVRVNIDNSNGDGSTIN